MSYLVLDIENDSSNQHGCEAGCFALDPIVAIAMKNQKELFSEYLYPNPIKDFQIDENILVGFNIAHDLLFLWHCEGLQEFFKRGGRIWDCQYAEYCFSGHQYKYPALRDVAVNLYGCQVREKLMEKYWSAGKKTHEIPTDLVLTDVRNDVLDTEQVYLKQLKKAEELGMLSLLEFEMDSILATTEMRFNGFKINKEILLKNKENIENDLKVYYNQLDQITKKYWL